jgi:hypothetical protein
MRIRSTTILALVAVAALAGCGVPYGVGHGRSGSRSSDEGDDESDSDLRPATDAPTQTMHVTPFTQFHGTLSETSPSAFGGSGACDYTMTLRNVDVRVDVDANGNVLGLGLTNETLEVIVGTCSNPPDSTHTQSFELRDRATPDAITLEGAKGNSPVARVTAELSGGDTASPALFLRWERTDLGPPWVWVVTAQVQLTPLTRCTPGATYCGASAEGHGLDLALVCAADGSRYTSPKRCPQGCDIDPRGTDNCR